MMSRELIGGPDGALSTLIIDPSYESCIDKAPTLESHQLRRDERDEVIKQRRLETLTADTLHRNSNQAVETLQRYAAELEPFGTRTMPPPWYKRLYHRWVYKFKEIVKIIKE